MTADPPSAAENLRDLLDTTVRACTYRARWLERHVASWPEESKERERLLGDVTQLLKIAELAQKIILMLSKDDGRGACTGSCQTFAAAMVEAQEAAEREAGPQ